MEHKAPFSYAQLPGAFFSRPDYAPVEDARMVIFNDGLWDSFSEGKVEPSKLLAFLSGNQTWNGQEPLAQAYAGHQFGHFTMLGDGRAMMCGEVTSKEGRHWEAQWKGSGRTAFSRGGDGRATLYSMLREYLISEAMHHLGIPSSRSLSVVDTGEVVYRQTEHKGAVLTRLAPGFIRVGTFEYARQFTPLESYRALLDYVIRRYFPSLTEVEPEKQALSFLEAVMHRQIDLVVHWMRVGFIHGVMNTDNTSITGETFDYGPCAFMNSYDPQTVYSSIDQRGRYAFGQQPGILRWNLAVLGSVLLPLMPGDKESKVALVKSLIDDYSTIFSKKMYAMLGQKIGLVHFSESDKGLVDGLLDVMYKLRLDYTHTFIDLEQQNIIPDYQEPLFLKWKKQWVDRIENQQTKAQAISLMRTVNPYIIPRNHWVEKALSEGAEGDMSFFQDLFKRLQSPYSRETDLSNLPKVGPDFDQEYQTFCGT